MSKEIELQAIVDNLRQQVANLEFELKKLREQLSENND